MQGAWGWEKEFTVLWESYVQSGFTLASWKGTFLMVLFSLCVYVSKSECPVHLGNARLPTPMLVQKHVPKVKAMRNVYYEVISFETEYASFMTWNSGVLEGEHSPVMEFSKCKDYFLPPCWTAERRAKCTGYLRSKYTWELRECRSGSDLYSSSLQRFTTAFIALTVWTCSAQPNPCEIW